MQLTEKYRPRTIAGILGQPTAVSILSGFVSAPEPCAFLFTGETGVGKTSSAYALATDLGVAVDQHEFGGLHEIASGEQTAESVREKLKLLHNIPMIGSGWKVLIVNECDRMSAAAETIWLDALEHLPARTVIVFTTNSADKLAARFVDRCSQIQFESYADKLESSIDDLTTFIWQNETGRDDKPDMPLHRLVHRGHASFRRAVQEVAKLVQASRAPVVAA